MVVRRAPSKHWARLEDRYHLTPTRGDRGSLLAPACNPPDEGVPDRGHRRRHRWLDRWFWVRDRPRRAGRPAFRASMVRLWRDPRARRMVAALGRPARSLPRLRNGDTRLDLYLLVVPRGRPNADGRGPGHGGQDVRCRDAPARDSASTIRARVIPAFQVGSRAYANACRSAGCPRSSGPGAPVVRTLPSRPGAAEACAIPRSNRPAAGSEWLEPGRGRGRRHDRPASALGRRTAPPDHPGRTRNPDPPGWAGRPDFAAAQHSDNVFLAEPDSRDRDDRT